MIQALLKVESSRKKKTHRKIGLKLKKKKKKKILRKVLNSSGRNYCSTFFSFPCLSDRIGFYSQSEPPGNNKSKRRIKKKSVT